MSLSRRCFGMLLTLLFVITGVFVLPAGNVSAAAAQKQYVSSVKLGASSFTLTIPAGKTSVKKRLSVQVKTKGKKVSRALTVKSSNQAVATVRYNVKKRHLTVTGKAPGSAVIKVTTKARSKKGKRLTKKLRVTVVRQGEAAPAVPASYAVYFETNGGSSVAVQTVTAGGFASQPAAPVKEGASFLGWYADAAFNMPYSFGTPVNGDLTLYAKWNDSGAVIQRFTADTAELTAGEAHRVTFTAEMTSSLPLLIKETPVYAEGAKIAMLNDNGKNGDQRAGDGVYTATCSLSSAERGMQRYYTVYGSVKSRPTSIYFYTEITDEDFRVMEEILHDTGNMHFKYQVKDYLAKHPGVAYYADNANSVLYRTTAGITGIWNKPGLDAFDVIFFRSLKNKYAAFDEDGGLTASSSGLNYADIRRNITAMKAAYTPTGSKHDVCALRPFHAGQFYYEDYAEVSRILAKTLGGKAKIIDDGAADLDAFRHLDRYGLVLLDSHGTKNDWQSLPWTDAEQSPYIVTGDTLPYKAEDWSAFRPAELQSEGIIFDTLTEIDGEPETLLLLGSGFFDLNYTDGAFCDTSVFLGSCYSMVTPALADSFLNLGAETVWGFSKTVTTAYCNDTLFEITLHRLLGGETAQAAYDNTKSVCGSTDPYNRDEVSELLMRGNGQYTLVRAK